MAKCSKLVSGTIVLRRSGIVCHSNVLELQFNTQEMALALGLGSTGFA